MKKHPLLAGLLAVSVLLGSCGLKATPDPNLQIQLAVASTLAAMPSPAPAPTNPPIPTPTSFSLTGLFCEYQFCIGHPPEMAFFDISAQKNPTMPSTYSQGILLAYNTSQVIQLFWQQSSGATDPIFLMDLILGDGLDTPLGAYNLKLVHDLNVLSSPITTTASLLLPFGEVAGWVCGDRVFAWKVYTQQDGTAGPLFEDALARFVCEK